jgi:outer membrane lipoprotein-sorting protein
VKQRALAFCLLAALVLCGAAADEILTADQFFSQVSDRYSQVSDYEAHIVIAAGKSGTMVGTIAYKSPSLLRIDFTQPADQVISFNGEQLQVYIPSLHAILSQSAAPSGGAGAASLASKEGLRMMKRNYAVGFETGPAAVPLESGSSEQVIRLVLTRRSVSEGYKTIKLSIDPATKLIRRIEGWTLSNDYFVFDFTDIKTNQGMAETRFIYDSPASANVYNNFLFDTDN